jgi:hypothetical protein
MKRFLTFSLCLVVAPFVVTVGVVGPIGAAAIATIVNYHFTHFNF